MNLRNVRKAVSVRLSPAYATICALALLAAGCDSMAFLRPSPAVHSGAIVAGDTIRVERDGVSVEVAGALMSYGEVSIGALIENSTDRDLVIDYSRMALVSSRGVRMPFAAEQQKDRLVNQQRVRPVFPEEVSARSTVELGLRWVVFDDRTVRSEFSSFYRNVTFELVLMPADGGGPGLLSFCFEGVL